MARNEIDFGISFRNDGGPTRHEVTVTHSLPSSLFLMAVACTVVLCGALRDSARELSKERTVHVVLGVERQTPPADGGDGSVAVLVSTNIVPQACKCGFCRPEEGICVPEHIGSVGHDLRVEVTTNYLPIVTRRDERGLVVRRD